MTVLSTNSEGRVHGVVWCVRSALLVTQNATEVNAKEERS